jgi:hypothetical protein
MGIHPQLANVDLAVYGDLAVWLSGRRSSSYFQYDSLPLGEGGSAANEINLKQGSGVVVGELWFY